MVAAPLYRYEPNKAKTAANYPLIGNPHEHFYETRNLPILMAVQHITAGSSDFDGVDSSIENTVAYSARTATVASYHGGVDSDSIIDCLPDEFTAFAQGVRGHNFNSPALSLEIGLRDPDWRKAPAAWVDRVIRNAARWWAPRVKRYGIPLRVMTDRAEIDRLIAARKPVGFVEHGVLDPGNRADAGLIAPGVTTFPWALLFTYIREELGQKASSEEESMSAQDVQEIKDHVNALLLHGYTSAGKKQPAILDVLVNIQGRFNAQNEAMAKQAGQVAALSSAVQQLAAKAGQPLDLAAVEEAAREGAAEAIKSISVTVEGV